ncbi:translation initiation factor 2 [Pseudomonas putida]
MACSQPLPLNAAPLLVAQANSVVVPAKNPVKAAVTAKKAAVKKPAASAAKAVKKKPVASKTKSRKEADAVAVDLPKAKIDLTLPKAMVNGLEPQKKIDAAAPAREKTLLPSYFDEKKSEDFQLNGRLLSNEMQLPRRNEGNREVEGAALDFQFKQ